MFASNTLTKSKYGILVKNPTHIVHTYNISKDDIITSSESIISRKKFDIINYAHKLHINDIKLHINEKKICCYMR